MQPLVTVVTVTYNRAHILPSSIDSVLSQDYPNLRLLVVDDGSTDGTAEVLKAFEKDPRVEVLRHATNQGVIAARNTALDQLNDDVAYFAFNDSDDMLVPGAISKAVGALDGRAQHYSMVYAWARDAATGEMQGTCRGRDGSPRRRGKITLHDTLANPFSGDFFQLVRRDLVGSMRYDPRMGGGEGILWARILRMKPGLMIEDVLQLKDRSGADRVSIPRYDRASAEARMWVYVHELQTIGDDILRANPRRHAAVVRELAQSAAMAGDGRRARRAARQAVREDPSVRAVIVVGASLTPSWIVRRFAWAAFAVRSQRRKTLLSVSGPNAAPSRGR